MSRSGSLNLLIAASEAIPYAKTGGLADVTGALPQELAKFGHDVILIIPRHRSINGSGRAFQRVAALTVPTPQGTFEAAIEEDVVPVPGSLGRLRVWAIRYDPYFDRTSLYQELGKDYPDNLERFVFFSRAVIETAVFLRKELDWKTDLLHLHDWQTALCSAYLRTTDRGRKELAEVKTVLTLHNMGYQGLFPGSEFVKTGLAASLFSLQGLEFYGSANLLKGGIVFSDSLTTVSPTYAREILTREGGCGLEGVLRTRTADLHGILNGIDVVNWNPETDPYLPATYSSRERSGKAVCKRALQREFRLPEIDVPVIAAIGRMTYQKGFDLLEGVLPRLMVHDLQLVMLGTGEPSDEERFRSLQLRYEDRMGLRIGFDEGLAHRIEGGSDMLVMPSRYEPCGLSQLYSLRYGTVPVVRNVGGLADTVVPVDGRLGVGGQATGFHIKAHTPEVLLDSLRDALKAYRNRPLWEALVTEGMRTDVSWTRSAQLYDALFRDVVEG